jgi:hypothetical protein
MALDFPTSPSNGDTHQASNGIQYIFDSSKSQWKSQGEFSSGAIEVKKIDDISGSFNGSTVTFTLNSGGSVVKPHNNQSVLITLNGLVQDPGTAYTTSITTGQITFTSAPTSGKTFTGVIYSRLPVSSSTTLSTTGGTMTGDIVFNSSQTFGIGGIQDGNTSQKGVVQLSTSTTSTSETLAATASAVKSVKDAIPSNLGDLSNVSSSSPSTNHVLKWSGSEWAPSAESGGGASTLAALTDVSSATPSNGQVLKYNTASSQWEPGTDNTGGGSGGTTNLGAVASGAALTITSSSGDDASIPSATTSSWGAMTDEDKTKLDGIAASANVGITDVVGDTTPQLGGNLDVNGKDIVSVSNGDIEIDPNGSGVVIFKGNATKGSGQFKLNCENNSHGITIKGPPHSAAANYTLTLPNDDGSSSQYLQTNGSGVLSWASVDLSTYATLASPALTGTTTAVNLTLSGNLTVNGTTTTVSSTNTTITDNLLELNSGASSNANDSGIIIERGSTGDNAIIAWDESADKFIVGTTTGTADSTGDISITTGTLVANIEGNVTGNTSGSSGSCTGNAATATVASGLTGSPNVTVGTIGCGAITGTSTVSDSKGDLRTIVQNTQGSAYTLVAADAGKHILASGNITVPDSVFSAGQAITIINNTGGDLTINKGTNMYNAADGSSANRTLATRGMATILFTAADTSYISGAGLT